MTSIRDIMSGPVVTVDSGRSVADAARQMRDEDTGDVVVLQDGRIQGILTDRDLVIRVVAEDLDCDVPVSDVCTIDPVTITADESPESAAQLMRKYSIRRLPVRDDGKGIVGFVSLSDLLPEVDTEETLSEITEAAPNW
jgi:CBS domain-containing protein